MLDPKPRPIRTRTGRAAVAAAGLAAIALAGVSVHTADDRIAMLGGTVYANVFDILALVLTMAAGAHLLVCARHAEHPVLPVYACAAIAGVLPLVVPFL